ncbi:MAG: TetR/AcrR family transcriptional regulator [Bacillales bacterium]|jgi:AcrR family transcriptional regulator|nr:TetR/AcrR family transcriptional regulator [Bacillales bacterium]
MDLETRIPVRVDGKDTYNRIVNTAKKLFAKKGYHGTSINTIIATSKIATGTFYQYFHSKKELYYYLVNGYRQRIMEVIHNNIKDLTNRYDIEYYGIKAYLDFITEDHLAYQIIWELLFVDPKDFFAYYENFSKSYTKQLLNCGEIKEDIDCKVLSYVLIGISNFVGIEIISDKKERKPEGYYISAIMKILKDGIFK